MKVTPNTAYTYDPAGNITQAVSSYPWLPGQTFPDGHLPTTGSLLKKIR